MFNGQTISVIALMDLFFILVSYIVIRFITRYMDRWTNEESADPRWNRIEHIFKKLHVFKILYLILIFFVIQTNVKIISEILSSDIQTVDMFWKINLLLVANVVAAVTTLAVTGSKLAKGE